MSEHDQTKASQVTAQEVRHGSFPHEDSFSNEWTSVDFDHGNVLNFVVQLANLMRIQVLFTGEMRIEGQRHQAKSPDQIMDVLCAETMDAGIFLERAIIWNNILGYRYGGMELKAAVRQFIRTRKTSRKAEIIAKLTGNLNPLTQAEMELADSQWRKLSELFDIDAELVVACFKHFIWQVLRKQLNEEIEHHLMLVIIGTQGGGKSRFVEKFLSALQEVASAPVRTSDLIDKRVIGLLAYVALWCDDMEPVASGAPVANLKAFMSNASQLRRILHSSFDVTVKQNATLIGTSNHPVSQIISDDTGHRRFVELPFRNGNVDKGGDPKIWAITNSLAVDLLFRSVDPYLESPLKPFLSALAQHQSTGVAESALLRWLNGLDRDSDTIMAISTPYGVRAGELHTLYCAQTDSRIRSNDFASEMAMMMARNQGPFVRKTRDGQRCFYYEFRKPLAASNALR